MGGLVPVPRGMLPATVQEAGVGLTPQGLAQGDCPSAAEIATRELGD